MPVAGILVDQRSLIALSFRSFVPHCLSELMMHSYDKEPRRTCRLLAAAARLLRAVDPEDGSLAIELHDMARRLESLSSEASTGDEARAELHEDTEPSHRYACGNAN